MFKYNLDEFIFQMEQAASILVLASNHLDDGSTTPPAIMSKAIYAASRLIQNGCEQMKASQNESAAA